MDLQDNLLVIQERIIKTDEVIRLLEVKKKEANKLDKSYKKLIEKFCAKHTEVINLKNECQKLNNHLTNSSEIHLPCQKEISELKVQNKLLEQNHNDYVNAAEKKYQSACQEIATLNETFDSLNRKIEKKEFKDSKTKSIKKIQEELHEAKELLKDSILRYDDLENTSNETISDLKKECKNLEERRNEALKQLTKARLNYDELRKSQETSKNSPTKLKLQQKIEKLETKIQSFEIEQDILIQSHENDIAELKKRHEEDKKLFEDQLKELNKKIFEEKHIIKEKQDHENYITELTKKHQIEQKSLQDQIAKLESKLNIEVKNHEDDKIYLKELENKISIEVNKIKETIGTQTDYEDIYNLEDILTEMHCLPALMSPLISETSVKHDTNEDDIPKTCSIAVGTDTVLPTFIDSTSQTCESKIKVRSFNLCTEIFNNVDISIEKSNCSVATETDDFITLIDSCTQTNEDIIPVAITMHEINSCATICESLNINPNKTDIRTFDLTRELFNKANTPVETLSPTTVIEKTTDSSTQDDEDNDEIYVHLIPIKSSSVSTAVGSDDIIPTFADTSSQTCDFVNENQSKIKVRSFDVFNKSNTLVENGISVTDSSTQTSNFCNNYESKIEFKSFEPSVVTLPKNNLLEEIPKNVKLKSRVTKKYKNNKKNRLLNTLRNSKLNLKCLLEKYINTSSKFVIVSPSILKSDNSKISDSCEEKIEGCSNSYYSNCPHTVRHDNYCSCSCQQNMFYNRYFGQCPGYQIPCNFNHDMYFRANNSRNYYDMKQQFKSKHRNIDEIFSSSDSGEDDDNLRKVLRQYKNSVIKKYITNKYLAKIVKKNKNLPSDNFKHNINNTFINNREKSKAKLSYKRKNKNKFPKSKRIIFTSDSEEETAEFSSNNKTNTIFSSTKSNTAITNMNFDFDKDNCTSNNLINKNSSIPVEHETVSNHIEKHNLSSSTNFSINESNDEEIRDISKNIIDTSDEIGRIPKKIINKELEECMSRRTEENNKRLEKIINTETEENNKRLEKIINTETEENTRRKLQVNSSSSIFEDTNINRTLNENIDTKKSVNYSEKHATTTLNPQTSKLPFILRSSCTAVDKNISQILNEKVHNKKPVSNPEKHVTVALDNPQTLKSPFILSKKQQLLLRKGKSLKKGGKIIKTTNSKEVLSPIKTYATRSKISCTPLKRKSVCNEVEVVYKKQKQELFGSDSDSDTSILDECVTSEKTPDSIQSTDINNCSRISESEIFVQRLEQNETTERSVPEWPKTPERSVMLDNECNKEKLSDTTTDSIYPLNNQTKIRIALKKTETCIASECTNLLNEETNKVFKRPGICKINTSLVKKNKTEKESEIIFTDKDSPDSPDCSDVETNEYVTYNKLERPSISFVNKENESKGIEKRIDIDVAKKLITDVVTMDWDKQLMETVVTYLADKNSATVARLIVNEATKDFSQEFDKSFTPPAPLLTITQQKIMVLLGQLEKNNLPNIHIIFLQTVEKILLSETRVEVVHPLTRLYVASCKLKYEIEKVRTLCCNAAYYMGDLLLPLMFIVLTMWGDILPMAADSEDIPLSVAIVRVIHLKTCKKPGYNFGNLNRLLSDYYGYKAAERSDEEIIKQLIRSYSENYSKTAYTAIVIVCKNFSHKWSYNQIKNHLLPLLHNCNNSDNKLMTISLIQRIINQFQTTADKDSITDIKNCLSKYLINTDVPSI